MDTPPHSENVTASKSDGESEDEAVAFLPNPEQAMEVSAAEKEVQPMMVQASQLTQLWPIQILPCFSVQCK